MLVATGSDRRETRGRKRLHIQEDQEQLWIDAVTIMRHVGMKWKEIHSILHVNERWMTRWRTKIGFEDPRRSDITDGDLDELVRRFVFGYPERGEIMLEACLTDCSCFVSRKRLRESILRVDPEGRQLRRNKAVHRRVYSVPGPHHLWHIDGNHKLIAFNLVIHAGIDGFSRAIMYVRCSDNNTADTAFSAFLSGVRTHGCPSRVRTDYGGENIKIGEYMIYTRGLARGSILCGKSTHNQRIERQWRDMTKEVTTFYKNIFLRLQNTHLIDFSHEDALYCLHYVFLNRINEDLQRYMRVWNNHKLSTEHNSTPNKLLLVNSHVSAAVSVDEETYGVEDVFEEGNNVNENNQVVVSSVPCPMNARQFNEFTTYRRPLTLSDNLVDDPLFFDNYYLETLGTMREIIDNFE